MHSEKNFSGKNVSMPEMCRGWTCLGCLKLLLIKKLRRTGLESLKNISGLDLSKHFLVGIVSLVNLFRGRTCQKTLGPEMSNTFKAGSVLQSKVSKSLGPEVSGSQKWLEAPQMRLMGQKLGTWVWKFSFLMASYCQYLWDLSANINFLFGLFTTHSFTNFNVKLSSLNDFFGHNICNNTFDLIFVGVNQSEGCKICSTMLKWKIEYFVIKFCLQLAIFTRFYEK